MTARVGIILVHGIGAQAPDWANALLLQLRDHIAAEAARILGTPSVPIDEIAVIRPVHWADILQGRQRHLFDILSAAHGKVIVKGNMWKRLWTWGTYQLRHAERTFATEFIGDVIGYLEPTARHAVHATVGSALEALKKDAGELEGKRSLTIVAHSLGTVISADYLREKAKERQAQGRTGVHDDWTLENLFTIGSPLAMFSLRYGGPEIFTQPVAMETSRGRWVNIYDKDDPIGMPLRPLNDVYGRAVLKDVQVDSGDYLLAHTGYFTDAKTLRIISRKVALDWIARNGKLASSKLEALYAEYDQTLSLS